MNRRMIFRTTVLLTTLIICLSQCRLALSQEHSSFEHERTWKCAEQMMYTGFNSYERIVVADFSGDRLDAVRYVLRKSHNIEVLVVGGKFFSDSAFREIEALKSLKFLILDSANVSEDSLKKLLTVCPDLKVFRSEKSAVSELLSDFRSPRFNFKIDSSAAHLVKTLGEEHFRRYTTFDFSFDPEAGQENPLANDKLIYLKHLQNLERLDLSFAQVDDVSLQYLFDHAQLKQLIIPLNNISIESVEELCTALDPNELVLVVEDSYLTDQLTAKIVSIRKKLPDIAILNHRELSRDNEK